MRISAVVMNMFYTGLGIARSLGERGVPVIGLTTSRSGFGTRTRYARCVVSPDSRHDPDQLLAFLLKLARTFDHKPVLFPTRDDDVVFLDRYREELSGHFSLVVPSASVVRLCLDKWRTCTEAERAGVPVPKSWLIHTRDDLTQAAAEITYPCVIKPVEAYQWRAAGNWNIVGQRKAVGVDSSDALAAEYEAIARATPTVLVQEFVAGGDDHLLIAACYFDRNANFVAGFNTQKVVQVPAAYGTGCIVQSTYRPELFEPTIRLLQQMRYSGVAEVEYKWDAAAGQYKLIEINPRPWDQHRLGNAIGVDLIYLAYCDHASLAVPPVRTHHVTHKWIAEDVFAITLLRLLWRRDGSLMELCRAAQGRRVFAVWSSDDPLPGVAAAGAVLFSTVRMGLKAVWYRITGLLGSRREKYDTGIIYETQKGHR
jgi:D-aspartate ligase